MRRHGSHSLESTSRDVPTCIIPSTLHANLHLSLGQCVRVNTSRWSELGTSEVPAVGGPGRRRRLSHTVPLPQARSWTVRQLGHNARPYSTSASPRSVSPSSAYSPCSTSLSDAACIHAHSPPGAERVLQVAAFSVCGSGVILPPPDDPPNHYSLATRRDAEGWGRVRVRRTRQCLCTCRRLAGSAALPSSSQHMRPSGRVGPAPGCLETGLSAHRRSYQVVLLRCATLLYMGAGA